MIRTSLVVCLVSFIIFAICFVLFTKVLDSESQYSNIKQDICFFVLCIAGIVFGVSLLIAIPNMWNLIISFFNF